MTSLLDYIDGFNDDRDEGEQLRDQAFDLFRLHRPALVRRLQRAFVQHILAHGPNTSDPLRSLVEIPPGIDPRVVGFAVRSLSSDHGITRRVDSTRTYRKVAHARRLEVWAIPDAAKARGWLLTHPELI